MHVYNVLTYASVHSQKASIDRVVQLCVTATQRDTLDALGVTHRATPGFADRDAINMLRIPLPFTSTSPPADGSTGAALAAASARRRGMADEQDTDL